MKTDRNKRGKFCRSNNKGSYDELKVMRQKRWIFEHDRPPDIIKCIPLDDNVNRVPCSEHNYCSGSDMPIADESQDLISRQVEIPHEECRNIPNEDNSWRTGRRIVELGALAEGLAGCKLCGNPLHLTNCLGERKFGLAHILLVKCNFPSCRLVNDVPTGRKHRTDRGGNAWDVNTKLAAGMINGGFGETHVSSLLAALNIPSITHRNLKSREREVGAHLQLMAEESCKKHLEEEANLTNGDLSASFDGAWQKRGAGRGYNSLTGHASLIGEKTKKCISFSVKGKYCRVCTSAKKKGVPPRKHNCCRNWTGSAKSMEPAMACEMLQGVIDKGQRVQTLVMDNDSTTIARVKATVDHSITKKSDGNHIRKGLGGSLVELSKTHKVLRNYKVRTHIERCFMYSIRQNQNNATQLAADLEKIVPHLYGEHELCGTWCKSQKTDYKPKNLPYGKPLSSTPLRCDLEVLLRKYATKANELDSLGSTQYNESFNHMVSSKAPKRLFYGGSESLKTRVSATVCQKNDGYKYISELNKRCKMSPGKYTIKFASKLMHSLQKRQKKQSQQEFKRRRLELKHERSSKDATHSVLEGDTYDSKIGLELDEGDIDIEDINISPPEKAREQPLIFIDLETTGLARTSDIVQISAICDKDRFNIYTAPTQPISLEASQATGLTYVGGILKHNGQIVQTTDIKAGLEQFVEYLQKYKDPILIGHNIQNFDVPILINQLNKYDLISKLNTSASGFIDTLKLAKRIWKKPLIKNYKQETLVNFFLGINYEAHNAMADVISLQQLFEAKMSSSCLSADIFTLCYYTCKESLDPLVKAKAISSLTMKKLVACSLNLKKLKLIHKRNPEFGISHVFTESLEGTKTPRITKSKRVIEKIVDYLNK